MNAQTPAALDNEPDADVLAGLDLTDKQKPPSAGRRRTREAAGQGAQVREHAPAQYALTPTAMMRSALSSPSVKGARRALRNRT